MKPATLIAVLALAGIGLAAPPQAAYDLVIRGGQVVDGSGNPWFYADVAVKDGRIAAVGRLGNATATRTVDATGKIVTPGFIDLHSHSDGGIDTMELRSNHNMVAQGITLSVVNQDGRSPTPIRDQKALYEKQGVGTNVALMAGHGTARQRAMAGRLQQVATDADIAAMQKWVEAEMNEGAFGLSSGLEYEPGRWSETREVVELTRVVKPFGGFYISHERSEGPDPMWHLPSDPTPYVSLLEAVNETITIGRETGVPVVASHLKAKGVTYWGSSYAATRLIRDARAQGIEVYADQYPYETSGTDGSTVLIPAWATRPLAPAGTPPAGGRGGRGGAEGGPGVKVVFKERLANADDNAKIRRDIAHEIDRRGGATRLIIGAFPDPKYVQKSLQFVADDLKAAEDPPLRAGPQRDLTALRHPLDDVARRADHGPEGSRARTEGLLGGSRRHRPPDGRRHVDVRRAASIPDRHPLRVRQRRGRGGQRQAHRGDARKSPDAEDRQHTLYEVMPWRRGRTGTAEPRNPRNPGTKNRYVIRHNDYVE
jgi:N-acyl-D-amino-acid deacylase